MPDPTLAIESVLDDGARDAILARFPDLRGATVADLLDMMDDADWGIEATDPLWEQWGDEAVDVVRLGHGGGLTYVRRLVGYAMLALLMAGQPVTYDAVRDLAAAAAQRVAA